METIKLIIEILLAGAGVAIFAAGRQFVKEVKKLKKTISDANEDNNISDAEWIEIGKAGLDAFLQAVKIWNLIKKSFGGKLKK